MENYTLFAVRQMLCCHSYKTSQGSRTQSSAKNQESGIFSDKLRNTKSIENTGRVNTIDDRHGALLKTAKICIWM